MKHVRVQESSAGKIASDQDDMWAQASYPITG